MTSITLPVGRYPSHVYKKQIITTQMLKRGLDCLGIPIGLSQTMPLEWESENKQLQHD